MAALVISAVAAAGVLLTAIVALMTRNKVIQVHALVNARLTEALDKISELDRIIGGLRQEKKNSLPQ